MTAEALDETLYCDERFAAECKAMPLTTCLGYGTRFDDCTGCPAYESARARVGAAGAKDERPDVRPAAGEDAP